MAGFQNNFREILCLDETFFVNHERLKNEIVLLMFWLITDNWNSIHKEFILIIASVLQESSLNHAVCVAIN